MYLIGIDVSKFKHDCFIATEAGEIIKSTFSFSNSQQGFQQFLDVLSGLDSEETKKIALEATGHYGNNLKIFLDHHGFDYMELNPYLVKQFSQGLTLRKTKTDKVDARMLSLILLSLDYKVYPMKSYHIQEIKSLTRYYKGLIKKRSKGIVELTNVLDVVFPEFKPFFGNRFSKTALFILEKYGSPDKIKNISKSQFEKICRESKGRFTYSKLVSLKTLADNTIGFTTEMLEYQIQSSIRLLNSLESEIEYLRSILEQELIKLNSPISTIRGVGPMSALSIISEYGGFDLFDSPAKMLSYAGLEPSVSESGILHKTGRMVKHGSSYLRETIMNVAASFKLHNPVIFDYYQKKVQEGKPHQVAMTHVAKKLIRIIFYLEKNNESFDTTKLR